MDNHNGDPTTEPEPNRWYNISLGPSLLSDGHSYSSRFCTLRYDFKPASIDNTQRGSFRKRKDNRVTLEFQNNQPGKPNVCFDGVNEDYDDRDAILFFDGENFRLEKLHRAVRLKYLRPHGESGSRVTTEVVPPVANSVKPDKVAQIDINNPVSLDHENQEDPYSSAANPVVNESEEDVNIDDDDDDGQESARKETSPAKEFRTGGLDIDINLPHPAEMEEEEDEIADVDINDDESYKGLNAAEALRAQVNAEAREESRKSSSSSSGRESESSESGAESSGSGSRSSSSNSGSRNTGSEGGSASESGSRASSH